MSNQLVVRRTKRETVALLGSSEAFTKRIVIWTLPPALVIAGLYDSNRFGTSRIGWVLVAVVAHMLATAVMVILRVTLLPKQYKTPRPAITLLIFLIGSVTRSLIIGYLAYDYRLAEDPELLYRGIAGGLLGTISLSIVSIFAAITKQNAETELRLKQDRAALVAAQESAEEFIAKQVNEIRNIISTSIEPSLLEISQNLKELSAEDSVSLKSSADRISSFITDTLRPLSTNLYQRKVVSIPEVPELTKKPRLLLLPKSLVITEVLSPMSVFAIWCLPNVTALYVYEGAAALPLVVLFSLPMLLIQTLIIKLPFARRPINGGVGLLILATIYATTWVGTIPMSEAFGIFLIRELNIIPAMILGMLILGMTVSYGFIVDANRMRYLAALNLTNSDLEREFSRTTQEVWLLRQRVAQKLHGTVQASLTAANMRILGTQKLTEDLLQKVRDDVSRASEAVENFESEHIEIKTALSDLTQLWMGMCEIQVDATPECLEQISRDQVCAQCVNEIVKECVSNAIRHGNASKIEIALTENENQTLQITVTNNGSTNLLGPKGVGTQILNELTMGWERYVEADKVTVSALVGYV